MDDRPEPKYDVEDASAGTADPSAKFRATTPSEAERAEIERTREERLDPDNRPENAEVDNTGREFDAARGEFTDTAE